MDRANYVIYAGDDLGVQGSVMNTHAVNLSRVFSELGYQVIFASQTGRGPDTDHEINRDGFHCFYPQDPDISSTTLRVMYNRLNSVSGDNIWKLIKRLCEEYNPKLIIYYGYACVRQLASYSKKSGIPFLVERTDWLEKDHYISFFDRNIYWRFTDICIRKWSKRATGIIAISDYFYDYYSQYLPTIKIPPLFDEDTFTAGSGKPDTALRLVYAGSPGNKDVLQTALIAVSQINRAGEGPVRFDIIGINGFEDVDDPDYDASGIEFHGRLPHEEALRLISEADCSLLLRYDRVYAKAGFSTKLSESMWVGVPVICTSIGGTDRCINDGVNGFLVPDNSVDSIRNKLKEILRIKDTELERIKKEAYQYAHRYFSYKEYVEQMRLFISHKLKASR